MTALWVLLGLGLVIVLSAVVLMLDVELPGDDDRDGVER